MRGGSIRFWKVSSQKKRRKKEHITPKISEFEQMLAGFTANTENERNYREKEREERREYLKIVMETLVVSLKAFKV